ncbi:MAG: biopolymer transporter ExbD [Chthoniobacterales bacterium]|nr:biopolymer transporter ExbD [Chthoniobacterales bacterium]
MNFRKQSTPEPVGFQIAPMVDIVFLLLIFFLVTWNFARYETELDVKVPTAKEGKESRRSVGEVIINVKSDGSIVMNRKTLTAEELGSTLKKISELYPDQAVVLRGDQSADYRHIVAVLDICRAANVWNVAFATGRPES